MFPKYVSQNNKHTSSISISIPLPHVIGSEFGNIVVYTGLLFVNEAIVKML